MRTCPVLRPRWDRCARSIWHSDAVFRGSDRVDSHDETLSGLNHAACTLPVYASRPQLPAARATLGSGCGPALPDGIDYPLGSTEKFPSSCPHYMTFPFPRLGLAHRSNVPVDQGSICCGRNSREVNKTLSVCFPPSSPELNIVPISWTQGSCSSRPFWRVGNYLLKGVRRLKTQRRTTRMPIIAPFRTTV